MLANAVFNLNPSSSSLSSTISRRKGENAQQVIDLSAALKVTEKEVQDKQVKIESLEAEMLILSQDLKQSEARASELESTNQLLKVLLNVKRHNCKTGNILFNLFSNFELIFQSVFTLVRTINWCTVL